MSDRRTQTDEFFIYRNRNGATLGTKKNRIKEKDGFVFKDLSGSPELLPYEDWRLDDETRASDLAKRLSVDEIAGLMLYSPHQMVPFRNFGPFRGSYDGAAYEEGKTDKWTLTDEQKDLMIHGHIRHFLQLSVDSAEVSARWNNALQELAESLPWGIPVNISTDPRHGASPAAVEFKSVGEDVSKWPEGLGMAATFDLDYCKKYAEIASKEYRALGITTALGPQIDLATDPRWMRLEDTFGGKLEQSISIAKAVIDGMQTTQGEADGWGKDSVITMAKHWPGGGTGEGGRDAHYPFGCFAVYPGGQFETHTRVFTDGAFALDGPTREAASVMPYYTVSWDQDPEENVGNSYSKYIIKDLLREKYGYDGVLCTDWGITGDPLTEIDSFGSRCYGVEKLTEARRHLKIIMNGIDQFGGNDRKEPILQAYELGCERYGESVMRARMEEAAKRLLRNMFRVGLFENPYLDPAESARIVGNPKFMEEGRKAQRASAVLLKNRNNCLPLQKQIRVYVPDRTIQAKKGFFRQPEPEMHITSVAENQAKMFYIPVDTPEEADAAIVFIENPISTGYSVKYTEDGGNGYIPVTLQYRPYTAEEARRTSIAGGDFREDFTDRSYRGKTNQPANAGDLDLILQTKEKMKEKPVIVCARTHNPFVVAEFEDKADAILIDFGVQTDVMLELMFGDYEPQGRLPVIMPKNMETVERHCEDIFDDIEAYEDQEGHRYTYGFGMNWSGVLPAVNTEK